MIARTFALVISVAFAFATSSASSQQVLKVPSQYKTIQAAVNAANASDTVLVAPGRYVGNLSINKKIWVRTSGGPLLTTLDGGGWGSVVFLGEFAGGLEGFTITNGYGGPWGGGGISIDTGSKCTVRDNIITGNQSDAGAGIRAWGGWAMITDNVISNNTAGTGGGIYYGIDGGWDTIARNVFSGNVSSNDGGGLYGSPASWNTIVRQNVFIRNRAGQDGGGVYVHWDYSQVYGNIFFDNTAVGNGGGAFLTCNRSQQIPVERCTFVLNSAGGGGGVCIDQGYMTTIRSSIFWQNRSATGPEIRLGTGSIYQARLTLAHSVVRGGPLSIHVGTNSTLNWGAGMLTSDPRFVDAAGGDHHLTAGSPCIDAAAAAVISPRIDFEGDPLGAKVDIGADEFFPHLYYMGNATRGGKIDVRVIGNPNDPAIWAVSNLTLNPPLAIPGLNGVLHLNPASLVAYLPLGRLPATGVLGIPVGIPSHLPPMSIPMQALIGLQLTNLDTVLVK